jgi:hypothetical protein
MIRFCNQLMRYKVDRLEELRLERDEAEILQKSRKTSTLVKGTP